MTLKVAASLLGVAILLATTVASSAQPLNCGAASESSFSSVCAETEEECVVRLNRTKDERVARQECCSYELQKNGTSVLASQETCCFQIRRAYNSNSEREECSFESCRFFRVEQEVADMKQAWVRASIAEAITIDHDKFSTGLVQLDATLGSLVLRQIELKTYERQLFIDSQAAEGAGDGSSLSVPWSAYAEKAAIDFIADLEDRMKLENPDPALYTEILATKYVVCFMVLQTMGFRYHPITEIRLRESRLVEWQNSIPKLPVEAARYAIPGYQVNPTKLPLPSSIDHFDNREALRAATAVTKPISDPSLKKSIIQTRPMCREKSMGRPLDSELNPPRPDWAIAHARWVEQELHESLKGFRRWRTDFFRQREIVNAKAKCVVDPQPGRCDDEIVRKYGSGNT